MTDRAPTGAGLKSPTPQGHVPVPTTRLRLIAHGHSAAFPDARWVRAVQRAALVVFPGLMVFAIVQPAVAGRILWTIAIASLPLFFVLGGYHRWRRICPLAFISQLPMLLGVAGQRRAGPWLRAHGYRVAFGVFIVSLWLRLVATNGDGYAIAIFLFSISVAAFTSGLIFTGKTWCNYLCPVFFVEKLYTEPRGLRDTPTSQCQKCTACRPACPDINEENSYWKEILLPDKRQVFFAFPGVVLAFYVYYFVQAGSWEYYFGGRWTHEVGLIRSAFQAGTTATTAGIHLLPGVPRAVAAALTLALGAALSLAVFSLAEKPIRAIVTRRDQASDAASVRHVMFSLAAFTAFIAFYSYAGAPTLRLVSGAPQLFQLVVVTTATLFLVRRIGRRQQNFAEETLARSIIAKWPWKDTPPPRDLHEAFLIHSVRSQQPGEGVHVNVLDLYKNAVRESVNSGVMSRADVHRLDSLRTDLRIAEADHERVMSELVEEDRSLIMGGIHASPEKQLQLEGYAGALAACLDVERSGGRAVDEAIIRQIRSEYGVTPEEHRAVLDRLVQSREGIAAHVLNAPAVVEELAAAIRAVETLQSPVTAFLSRLLTRRWVRTVDGLLHAVGGGDSGVAALRDGLLSPDQKRRAAALVDLGSHLSSATAARLNDGFTRASTEQTTRTDPVIQLRAQLSSPDPYVRATAIYILQSRSEATDADRRILADDEHPLVRETLTQPQTVADGSAGVQPSTLEKMIALCSVSLFGALEPEDLIRLAQSSTEVWFMKDDVLCREGDVGDEAFVVLAGEVSAFRRDGDIERLVSVEGVGTCIGELSVLDPAPRASTVIVSSVAVRALRLSGQSLRDAMNASPSVSEGIIRLLVRRLRGVAASAFTTPAPQPGERPN